MYFTNAFILRKSDFFENDRLLDVFTRDFGRIEVVARGTRKLESKLNPHLNFLNEIQIGIVPGFSRWVLTDAAVSNQFQTADIEAYKAGFKILEIAERLLYPNLEEKEIFELTRKFVRDLYKGHLCTNKGALCKVAALIFWSKCLMLLGYKPVLERCVVCSKEFVGEPAGFHLDSRGLVGKECILEIGGREQLAFRNYDFGFWRLLQNWLSSFEISKYNETVSSEYLNQAERFLDEYTKLVVPEL